MKKFSKVLVVIMVLALCVAFAGCGAKAPEGEEGASSLAGTTWVIKSIVTADGTEATGEDVAAMFGGETKYTFKEDGTGVVSVGEATYDMTYTESEGSVSVTSNGATTEMTYDGETITSENANGVCTLVRQ